MTIDELREGAEALLRASRLVMIDHGELEPTICLCRPAPSGGGTELIFLEMEGLTPAMFNRFDMRRSLFAVVREVAREQRCDAALIATDAWWGRVKLLPGEDPRAAYRRVGRISIEEAAQRGLVERTECVQVSASTPIYRLVMRLPYERRKVDGKTEFVWGEVVSVDSQDDAELGGHLFVWPDAPAGAKQ